MSEHEAEWIRDGTKMMIAYRFKCSACYQRAMEEYNYCPNCGARMRKAKDEELWIADLPRVRRRVHGDTSQSDNVLTGVPQKEK